MKRILLIAILVWLVPVWAWATDYYVWKDGAQMKYSTSQCDDPSGTNLTDIEDIRCSVGSSGDTVILCGGLTGVTYEDTDLDSTDGLDCGDFNYRGCKSTDSGCTNNTGPVTLKLTSQADHVVAAASTRQVENLTIENNTGNASYSCLWIAVASPTIENVSLIQTGLVGNELIFVRNDGTPTLNRVTVTAPKGFGDFSAKIEGDSTFNNCIITGGSGIDVNDCDLTLNNCIIDKASNVSSPIRLRGSAEHYITVNNSVISNNSHSLNLATIVESNSHGSSSITLNNSIWLPPIDDITETNNGTVVENDTLQENPRWQGPRRPSVLVLCTDDSSNISDFKTLCSGTLNPVGIPATFSLSDAVNTTSDTWDDYAALVDPDNGTYPVVNGISVHGNRCGNDCSDTQGMTFQYTGGDASAATVSITDSDSDGFADTLTTTITDGAGPNLNIDMEGSYPGLDDLVSYLNSLANYSCTLDNGDFGGGESLYLADASSTDINGTDADLDYAQSRLFKGEITDPKAIIETEISSRITGSFTVDTWAPPGTTINNDIRAQLVTDGYEGSRGNAFYLYKNEHDLQGVNVFDIVLISDSGIIGGGSSTPTQATVKKNAATLFAYMERYGGVVSMTNHGFTSLSETAWGYFVTEILNSNVQTMTLSDAVAWLKSFDPSGDLTNNLDKFEFNSGGTQRPWIGETITGVTSGETAEVVYYIVESGVWSGSDAAGYMWVKDRSGAFTDDEDFNVAGSNSFTMVGNASSDTQTYYRTPVNDPDYTLTSTSPCINTGTDPFTNGDGDQTDMAGETVWDDDQDRPVGTWRDGVDIGAYGYYLESDSGVGVSMTGVGMF